MRALRFLMMTCVLLALLGISAFADQTQTALQPPVAKIVPKTFKEHGHVRVDNYYWLKERDNPEVLAYLKAENDYTDAVMSHTKALQEKLFLEIKGRIKETDESVPYKLDHYYYYTRYEEGKSYPIYCRKLNSMDGDEEIMVDVNVLAEGHEQYRTTGVRVSTGENLIAYAVDTVGRRLYTIHFRNLDTKETLAELIPNVTGNMVWANDNKTLFYSKQDPVTLRWYQVYRHVMGSDPKDDVLVYQEDDDTFDCYVQKTKSKKYILIGLYQTLATEVRYLDADNPTGEFAIFLPRERGHEYSIDHFQDKFYIRTNYKAKNFRLMETKITQPERKYWKEVIPHRTDVLLESFEIFKNYLVVEERKNGLIQMRIRPWSGGAEHYIDFGEPAYRASIGMNPEMDATKLRYVYSSMTTPRSEYDYDMESHEKTLLKRDEVLGGFDPDNYVTERLYAPAPDGVKIPLSIVYRKGFRKNGESPLLLYGYGSYGYSTDASFDSDRLSLLDRGFVFGIAHVRGGEELGRQWYEDGKLLKKKNTFTDFIACAEYLVRQKYTNPTKLFAAGGSAGGLLMGAIMNMRPDLFRAIVTRVPFVDVVTTMLDATIPLTTAEYDEWGNPNEKKYYDYMLSYSPYDNVEAKAYPNLLVLTGLHDSQVQYWEPAKWVAKVRALKTNDSVVLLKTNMEAGHSGASGRYDRYRETAFQYAFLLDLIGYTEQARAAH